MQKLLLVYLFIQKIAPHKPNQESTSKYGFSPDLGGKWGVLSMRMQVISYPGPCFRARVQPRYGAGRKESSGTGL